jgi:proline dehydrogenase
MNLFNKIVIAVLPAVPRSIVKTFASRYIAGEEISDAVRVVRELNRDGILATLDVLGEDITQREEAIQSRDMILSVLDAITAERLDSNVSVKLTQVGLKLDRQFCLETMRPIVRKALDLNNFIRIDMEDSSCTDDTLWVYRELRKEFSNVGIVLQGYLRRTAADAEALLKEGLSHIRLCKGIYIEPEAIAYKGKSAINNNFIAVLDLLLRGKAYVGIATHDDELIEAGYRLVRDLGLPRSAYEFQMLLGVRPELRARINRDGHRLRIYVPFGRQWYRYSIRRFKENPQVAGNVIKALFSRN